MSRIETALEKASQLRNRKPSADASTRSAVGSDREKPGKAWEEMKIDNPFVVTLREPASPASEEYRKLKSLVIKLANTEGFKNTVAVTSSVSGEGKSITAINLAISLSQEYDRSVLLVDADMRRPSLHRYLDIKGERGLSECLVEGIDIGEALVMIGAEGKLAFLAAGGKKENPVELFSSKKMQELLRDMKRRYADRYIVIDTPPVLPFAEAKIISALADGAILVVKEGAASLQNITDTVEALQDTRLMGIVYNDASEENLDGHYHYGYYTAYERDKEDA